MILLIYPICNFIFSYFKDATILNFDFDIEDDIGFINPSDLATPQIWINVKFKDVSTRDNVKFMFPTREDVELKNVRFDVAKFK